jgi:hypothetical protein
VITLVRSHVVRFKGRRFNPRAKVKVYRNLNRPGHWYSVVQGGRVVGHSEFLLLNDVECQVAEAGRKRCLETGVKNVHAYLVGYISYTEQFFGEGKLLQHRHRAGYLPRLGHFWVDYKSGMMDPFGEEYHLRMGMKCARSALLSRDGLSVNEPTTFELTGT